MPPIPNQKLNLSPSETMKVLEVLARELWGAQIQTADEVCYGGVEGARKAGEEERRVERVWNAFPKSATDEYLRLQRKGRADELRAKADLIEAGKLP